VQLVETSFRLTLIVCVPLLVPSQPPAAVFLAFYLPSSVLFDLPTIHCVSQAFYVSYRLLLVSGDLDGIVLFRTSLYPLVFYQLHRD
jgi:hypothetical protein